MQIRANYGSFPRNDASFPRNFLPRLTVHGTKSWQKHKVLPLARTQANWTKAREWRRLHARNVAERN
jgi:hypothetical protein